MSSSHSRTPGFVFTPLHLKRDARSETSPRSPVPGNVSRFVCPNRTTRPSRFVPDSVAIRRARFIASADVRSASSVPDVAVLILAGGVGSRMKAGRPKQFLHLDGRTILQHSVELFCSLPEVAAVVIVVEESHRGLVEMSVESVLEELPTDQTPPKVVFADPGIERQDSVRNGLAKAEEVCTEPRASLVAVHDSARPLVTATEVRAVIADARQHGAAVLGVPCKATVKESADGSFVLRTVPRERLWEVHTPQVIRPEILRRGFDYVDQNCLAVTDDVSIVEQLGEPVKLTLGEYTNIKITTPEDLDIAESILVQRAGVSTAV